MYVFEDKNNAFIAIAKLREGTEKYMGDIQNCILFMLDNVILWVTK